MLLASQAACPIEPTTIHHNRFFLIFAIVS